MIIPSVLSQQKHNKKLLTLRCKLSIRYTILFKSNHENSHSKVKYPSFNKLGKLNTNNLRAI